jgi:hypothetical protein
MNNDELTNEQLDDAIRQMIVHCELKMQNYEGVSARGALIELGYGQQQLDQVLADIAARGFDYCLDRTIECSDGEGGRGRTYPSQDVCVWGPDQLKSRLQCLRSRG